MYVPRPEWYKYAVANPSAYGPVLMGTGSTWFVVDNKVNQSSSVSVGNNLASFATTSASAPSDLGESSVTFDDGGTIYSRGYCVSPWDPTKWTRYGSGIVTWASSPVQAGFSMKDENDSSGLTSQLRCPSGPYRTDYYVDGVYKRQLLFIAYKIPNHCTAVRGTYNGKLGYNCCCNAAGLAAGYGYCSDINALNYQDWPDAPKLTCR